jgi:hypothetical protein
VPARVCVGEWEFSFVPGVWKIVQGIIPMGVVIGVWTG